MQHKDSTAVPQSIVHACHLIQLTVFKVTLMLRKILDSSPKDKQPKKKSPKLFTSSGFCSD